LGNHAYFTMIHRAYLRPTIAFVVLVAVSMLVWWRALASTFYLAFTNDAYTHILLILPVSAALIYMDQEHQPSKQHSPPLPSDLQPDVGQGIAAALLASAVLLAGYARWKFPATSDLGLSLNMFALVTWWLGSVQFCLGIRTLQSLLFPLCFLFLMVPLPQFALTQIVELLQQGSASAARSMFRSAGVQATQDGVMLSIPGLDIEVASECSSIRSSLMLLVSTMVLAHLFLRSWWRKALLIAAVIPVAVAKNGLRIFTIAELGTRLDPAFLNGRFHHNGGIIFYAIALLVVVALLVFLRHAEARLPVSSAATPRIG
jgi:exosortase